MQLVLPGRENYCLSLYKSASCFVSYGLHKGVQQRSKSSQTQQFSYFSLLYPLDRCEVQAIWRRYMKWKKKSCLIFFLQKMGKQNDWLLIFQESFNLFWLCSIHSTCVNAKWTLSNSLMGTWSVFVRRGKETSPLYYSTILWRKWSWKDEVQVKAIYVLWHTVQLLCALGWVYIIPNST